MKMPELIKELRQWRGDILVGLPAKRGLVYLKLVKSDLIKAMDTEKKWGSDEAPFRFRIMNGVGILEYHGFKAPPRETPKRTPSKPASKRRVA